MWWEYAKNGAIARADEIGRFGARDQAVAIKATIELLEALKSEFGDIEVGSSIASEIANRSCEHLERMVRENCLEDHRPASRGPHRFRLGNLMDHFDCKWPASRAPAAVATADNHLRLKLWETAAA